MIYNECMSKQMKKQLYITVASLLFIIINPGMGWSAESLGPKMILKEKVFDAKEVREGDIIQHTFKVGNTGDQPLKITKVAPT